MTERRELSVLDLCKDQVALTNLWPLIKNSCRNYPVQEDAVEQRHTEGCISCISQGDETHCHPNLKKGSKMNSSTPQRKSKGEPDKNSFFGIDLDQEHTFLETGHLSSFISSQLNRGVLLPIFNNIDTSVKLHQREGAVKSSVDTPKKIFPVEPTERDLEPKKLLENDLSNFTYSVAQVMSPPWVESKTELDVSADKIILYPSPSSFLQEVKCQSCTPLRSISNKYVRDKRKNSNKELFPDLLLNQEQIYEKKLKDNNLCQNNVNRNDNARESCMLVELSEKDSEKHKSPIKVFSSSLTCNKTEVISGSEMNKMGGNPLNAMTKDCHSSVLTEQGLPPTMGIGRFPEINVSSTNYHYMNMVSQTLLATAVNRSMTPEKRSAISSKINEKDNTNVIDGVYEAAEEEELSVSLSNMFMSEGVSFTENLDEVDSNLITLNDTSDSSDSVEILNEEAGEKCRTQIGTEGELHHSLDNKANNNDNHEVKKVKGNVSSYSDVSECASQYSDQKKVQTKNILKLKKTNRFPMISQEKKENDLKQIVELPPVTEENTACSTKAVQPVKAYMLPFVSNDPEENKDNEDPRWSYLAKLKTDEERYQLSRKLWKSIVVPDPNVDMTYFGCLRRWRAHRNSSKGVSSIKRTVSQKRKCRLVEDLEGQPPTKRARGIEDISFSVRRFEESMKEVTMNYEEELNNRHLSRQQKFKLEQIYTEKMHQLDMARSEVKAIHNFYSGLPDQELSLSQASVEAEQSEIEQFYTRFKQIYGWDGRAFIP